MSKFTRELSSYYLVLGAFRFRLWRFGCWEEVIVDDFLPVLDEELAYAPLLTPETELWAALLEKAFAKYDRRTCHKHQINAQTTY